MNFTATSVGGGLIAGSSPEGTGARRNGKRASFALSRKTGARTLIIAVIFPTVV